ncbi:MAG: methylenetetrahydrofolate--tRNA-(uracil(54)-C(5))-methyltransferase (FADH(2)-oxidizing) TrmFO [Armatimonadetes bacterium]|nr:methylenetetrahydrofolate--tRNA-(uracil(54)-C(5))-methyltransferase (FADH(2)-oxidizing) TrmFO [Armatimonadota bacterium]
MADAQVVIVGAGLAGSEAAWQVASRGVRVRLYEMRPVKMTEAHTTDLFAELVCSNSLKAQSLDTGPGLLKEELRRLGSLLLHVAAHTQVPAGQALAVDRERFARAITDIILGHPNIEVVREEVTAIPPDTIVIIATGPLTSQPLARDLFKLTGENYLFFYDAIAPIVDAETIDYDKTFFASRYGKGGEDDYLNCPLNEEEYRAFEEALLKAEVSLHADVSPKELFEGCLPIEVIARRGRDALRFGPMKPVGLIDPRTRRQPYAVVQLRPENLERTMYNLVGFQTSLKYGEQERVFRMIPALAQAEFLRYGQVHRNTYINAPVLLLPTFQSRARPGLFFAGQITGVEGYVPSTGSGLLAGLNAARLALGQEPLVLPRDTMLGALAHYITHANPDNFQPMNANFGILPPPENVPKKQKRMVMAQRAVQSLETFLAEHGIEPPPLPRLTS